LLGWGFPFALLLAAGYRLRKRLGRKYSDGDLAVGDDRPLPRWLNAALEHITYWEWRGGLTGLKMPLGVSRLILARKSATRDNSVGSVDGSALSPRREAGENQSIRSMKTVADVARH
jgi:hypothetical protein